MEETKYEIFSGYKDEVEYYLKRHMEEKFESYTTEIRYSTVIEPQTGYVIHNVLVIGKKVR